MTTAIAAALCAACLTDWIARARAAARLEFVSKPLATGLVIALAVARGGDDAAVQGLLVGALLCCLAGDVLLLPIFDRFVAGLAAFLVAHSLFLASAALRGLGAFGPALAIGVATAVAISWIGHQILAGATRRDARLRLPVLIYILTIAALPPVVAATGRGWALAGALCFAISDAMLGFDRFVRPLGFAPVGVMVSYHLAIIGLTLGLG